MPTPITKRIPKFDDDRGWFISTFSEDLPVKNWVMQNTSFSKKNTIRGLHFQSPHAQSKLITVIEGSITDIVLNIDPNSDTFAQFLVYQLSSTDSSLPNQIFIPNHYAHGFAVTSDTAMVSYMTDDIYHPETEEIINPYSESLSLPWGIENPIISPKDANAPAWDPEQFSL